MSPAAHHTARLLIEYDGTNFRGWSRQPEKRTIEGELRAALARLRGDVHELRCAGRTDAGVHATGQVASLAYDGPVPPGRLAAALNGELPGDLAIVDARPCDPQFDARAHALSRAYEYRVLTRRTPSPVRAGQVLFHPQPLDLDLLQRAAALVEGRHDFTAFTPTQTKHVFFHRTVLASSWSRRGDELVYEVRANAFLRHMVRILVGTMLAVGRGDRPLDSFATLLDGAPRSEAHHTAPAHALVLADVEYAAEDAVSAPDAASLPDEVSAPDEAPGDRVARS